MITPSEARDIVEKELGGYVKLSGKVFYSSLDTLAKAEIAFIGYNPGGSPGDTEEERIAATLSDIPPMGQNHFVHQFWKDSVGKRYNPLQKRVQGLFRSLDIPIGSVYTTNLYFQRTRGIRDPIDESVKSACWNVHQKFIAVSRFNFCLCNGVTTFREMLARISDAGEPPVQVKTYHSKWHAYCATRSVAGRSIVIFGLPHLSWFSPEHDPDLISLLVSKIRDARQSSGKPDKV